MQPCIITADQQQNSTCLLYFRGLDFLAPQGPPDRLPRPRLDWVFLRPSQPLASADGGARDLREYESHHSLLCKPPSPCPLINFTHSMCHPVFGPCIPLFSSHLPLSSLFLFSHTIYKLSRLATSWYANYFFLFHFAPRLSLDKASSSTFSHTPASCHHRFTFTPPVCAGPQQ